MTRIKRRVCFPYGIGHFGEFVGGGNEGDHLGFAFGYFLLVELLKGIWSLYGNIGAVVEESAEYVVPSLGDVPFAVNG